MSRGTREKASAVHEQPICYLLSLTISVDYRNNLICATLILRCTDESTSIRGKGR